MICEACLYDRIDVMEVIAVAKITCNRGRKGRENTRMGKNSSFVCY